MKETVKEALYAACKQYVQERVANATLAIASASDAATDETKSSAGDKFETTREMMQQEISRHQQLLAGARQMDQVLDSIDIHAQKGPAKLGSLVETNKGFFFLAVSAGQLYLQGKPYFAVSVASPVGRLMLGKVAGDRFTFNNVMYQVINVS